MKLSKKILSVLLAAVMVLSMIPIMVSADSTDSFEEFLDADNLTDFVGDLLTNIADRKEEITGTVLRIVYLFITDSDFQTVLGDTNVMTATDEELADVLVEYLDDYVLPDLLSSISSYTTMINSVVRLAGLYGNLNDISGFVKLLASAGNSSTILGLGDLEYLDTSALYDGKTAEKNVICTDNGYTNLETIYALFDFLASDGTIQIVSELLHGDLELGSIVGLVDLDDLIGMDDINDTMANLPALINGLLYEYLCPTYDADGNLIELEDSIYADFSTDELLAAALLSYIQDDEVTQADASAAASMTLYELIGTYAEAVIEKYALDYINNDLKELLASVVTEDGDFAFVYAMINWDYEVDASTFNLSNVAEEGIASQVNTILYGILTAVLSEDALAEIDLVDGDNSNIQANLENALAYIFAAFPDEFMGYDFSEIKAQLDTLSLEEIVVEILKVFWDGWFGTTEHLDEIDTLETLAVYAAYLAVENFLAPAYSSWIISYDDELFDDDGTIVDEDEDYFIELLLNIGLDVAVWTLDHNSSSTYFELDPETAVAYKEAGWTWVDFLDEIVDWALNFVDGFPAIADELSTETGVTDGFGPFYKLNVIFNNLISFAFINDCGDGYFYADTETIFNTVVDAIFNLNISNLTDILDVNDEDGNYFNMPVISSVLNLLTDIVDGIVVYDDSTGSEVYTYAATSTAYGYTYTLGENNYFYHIESVIDLLDVEDIVDDTDDIEEETEAETEAETEEETEEETEADEDVLLGDVNFDGSVNMTDARLALIISLGLQAAEDDEIAAGDIDGDGSISMSDARSILRVGLGLDTF